MYAEFTPMTSPLALKTGPPPPLGGGSVVGRLVSHHVADMSTGGRRTNQRDASQFAVFEEHPTATVTLVSPITQLVLRQSDQSPGFAWSPTMRY